MTQPAIWARRSPSGVPSAANAKRQGDRALGERVADPDQDHQPADAVLGATEDQQRPDRRPGQARDQVAEHGDLVEAERPGDRHGSGDPDHDGPDRAEDREPEAREGEALVRPSAGGAVIGRSSARAARCRGRTGPDRLGHRRAEVAGDALHVGLQRSRSAKAPAVRSPS